MSAPAVTLPYGWKSGGSSLLFSTTISIEALAVHVDGVDADADQKLNAVVELKPDGMFARRDRTDGAVDGSRHFASDRNRCESVAEHFRREDSVVDVRQRDRLARRVRFQFGDCRLSAR